MEKKKNRIPVYLIGVGLLVVMMGGLLAACSGASNANGGNKNTSANKPASTPPANVPVGASPPNQSGSPTASVTVEEFADFQCPQCGNVHPMVNEIKSIYGSRIHFIFRNFPLAIPAHDKSYEAAVAAEAAGLQGPNKFFEMQNLLFTNQKAWTDDKAGYKNTWKGYAKTIGLDVDKWETDRLGIAAKGRVDADMARGKGLNISGTPSIYINGNSVPFAEINVDGLKKLIDAELAKAPAASSAAPAANNAPAETAPANTKK